MAYCPECKRSDVADRWQWCPRCGANLLSQAPANPAATRLGSFVDLAINTAETLVKSAVEHKINSFTQKVGISLPSNSSPASSGAPDWYGSTVAAQQPHLTPNELAKLQAAEITRTRTNIQMAQSAMSTMSRLINTWNGH